MTSLRAAAGLLALLVPTAVAGPKVCPANVPLSCHNTGPVTDTCCFIPTGQLLQTQFWDVNPPTGPADSWTIHGLWPDNCDGSFPAACDASRAYTNITDILSAGGADDTLSYMQTYWKDYGGNDERFWEHEWAKHGTCISTFSPKCYDGYQSTEEAVDFFSRTVELFKTLPTYEWLADAGITPDKSKSYATADVQAALSRRHGAPVTLGCKGKRLNEVWYHFNVRGSLQSGQFVATQPDGPKSTCGKTVYYNPKAV
ncbi:Ribonuclease Trv [Escovopsis weberi]|uniref:ribonuclease T2 n=1 Tax=Escovopsis weberi TaxID=150374 RepID=A0A0M8N659_ESCWE|nr:Ribonuclease Trv [Escovopsis weberi]